MAIRKGRSMNFFDEWAKTCLKKKRLKEHWADQLVFKTGGKLRKYYCPHCDGYHVTSQIPAKEYAKVFAKVKS
jgi:hypothetical protein